MKGGRAGGGAAFDETYSELYGPRWEALKDAMRSTKDIRAWNAGGVSPYLLDSASILAALSLPLAGAERIFDCCAAPGGKTVVLATMMEKDAALTANDRSRERVSRLKTALRECLPPSVQGRVSVTSTDAALLAKRVAGSAAEQNRFDAILLDAPCSSERHVLASEYHLAQWTPARIRNLCVAQWALLSAAFRLLNPGGVLTYATCALHLDENDGTVQKLLKKFPGAKIVPPQKIPEAASAHFDGSLPESEQTETGRLILPDTSNGAGPLFFSCVKKESE